MSTLNFGNKTKPGTHEKNNRRLVKLAKAAREHGVDSLTDSDVESIADINYMMEKAQRNRGVSNLLSTNQLLVLVAVEMMDYPNSTSIMKTIRIGISQPGYNKILHRLEELTLIERKEKIHFNNGGRALLTSEPF